MSRSYKKFPFCKDRNSCKWGKRYANKKVRNTEDVPNGKGYKKLIEPWDFIYDYSSSMTWREYQQFYQKYHLTNSSLTYREWYKYYKMK